MICPQCKKKRWKSFIYPGVSSATLLYCNPYYDEAGKYHHHDSNNTTTDYSCSKGHSWATKSTPSCWCGWPEFNA